MTTTKQVAANMRKNGLTGIRSNELDDIFYFIKNDFYKVVRPVTNGSRSYIDHTASITKILTLLNVAFTTGNDAPRGGKTGNYIAVSKTGLNAAIKNASGIDWLQELADEKAAEEKRLLLESEHKAAIVSEASAIEIDDDFIGALKWANEVSGVEKNNRHSSAMKGLLQRRGIEKIHSDFWQVFRILKKRAENSKADIV